MIIKTYTLTKHTTHWLLTAFYDQEDGTMGKDIIPLETPLDVDINTQVMVSLLNGLKKE